MDSSVHPAIAMSRALSPRLARLTSAESRVAFLTVMRISAGRTGLLQATVRAVNAVRTHLVVRFGIDRIFREFVELRSDVEVRTEQRLSFGISNINGRGVRKRHSRRDSIRRNLP